MEKTVAKFRDFAEAEKSDREFYRRLSGRERLDILLEITKEALIRQETYGVGLSGRCNEAIAASCIANSFWSSF